MRKRVKLKCKATRACRSIRQHRQDRGRDLDTCYSCRELRKGLDDPHQTAFGFIEQEDICVERHRNLDRVKNSESLAVKSEILRRVTFNLRPGTYDIGMDDRSLIIREIGICSRHLREQLTGGDRKVLGCGFIDREWDRPSFGFVDDLHVHMAIVCQRQLVESLDGFTRKYAVVALDDKPGASETFLRCAGAALVDVDYRRRNSSSQVDGAYYNKNAEGEHRCRSACLPGKCLGRNEPPSV
nr:hypothetical protein CFP56_26070 [Quercus suber]